MKSVKRVEIIIERSQRDPVLERLSQLGANGWSVLPVITGSGGRGERGTEGLPGSLENDLILVAVDEDQVAPLVESLRPLLKRWGGVVLVSDALWLKH